jgi:regulator of ribonuclease activity A
MTLSFLTTDLCDAHEDKVRVVEPMFSSFGGRECLFWAHRHAKAVRGQHAGSLKTLESPGKGRVLVIDGGGSLRRALVGDQLAALAVKNSWAGIVVYGCIRDSRAIGEMDIGVVCD